MEHQITCINCPVGCRMTVTVEDGKVTKVAGNTCKRGDSYARTEITNPMRSLTTSVKVCGGVHPVVPVKSSGPVPKGKMFDCMEAINAACVKAPVKIGDIVIKDILGLGVDIIATNCDEGK